jgi:hypothetical protein
MGSTGIGPPLTSALDGGEWSTSRPGRFTTGTNWVGGWVGHRAGLDTVEKRKISSPDHQAGNYTE